MEYNYVAHELLAEAGIGYRGLLALLLVIGEGWGSCFYKEKRSKNSGHERPSLRRC